jgi:hypothetical protein
LEILKNSNSLLPPAILASTLLALIFPPSLTWFTTRYVYVPDELVDENNKMFYDYLHFRKIDLVRGFASMKEQSLALF